MDKYRKAFYEIEKALTIDAYGVIILFGLRKTGKTTILMQLAEKHNGYYIDFRKSENSENDYMSIFDRDEKLILLDEIGYLQSYDAYFGNLEKNIKSVGKKVVITSSSYGTLKQLESESLGGGRSHPVQLFPLNFEEYLYFSGKITKYSEDYEPTEEDLQNFYRLKNLPEGMDFIINREYLRGVFTDTEVARDNAEYNIRDICIDRRLYASVLDVIAYTLNDSVSLKRFTGKSQIGAQEFTEGTTGIPISHSLISLASNILRQATNGLFQWVEIKDLAHIVAYLYHNGFLFIDLICDENGTQSTDRIRYELALINGIGDFERVFNKYIFSVISPLLYTRLMVDLEDIADKLCTGPVYGRLYELTVKSESVYKLGYDIEYYSHKYKAGAIEVDIWDKNLLFEAAIGKKENKDIHVDKVAVDYHLIRVLTSPTGKLEFNGIYYKIGYQKALLMISNDTIYDLESTRVIDCNGRQSG